MDSGRAGQRTNPLQRGIDDNRQGAGISSRGPFRSGKPTHLGTRTLGPCPAESCLKRIQVISHGIWLNIMQYLRNPSRGMPLHVMLFAVLAAAACAARNKKRRRTADGIDVPSAMEAFDRPYSTSLIIVLGVATATLVSHPRARKRRAFGFDTGADDQADTPW